MLGFTYTAICYSIIAFSLSICFEKKIEKYEYIIYVNILI